MELENTESLKETLLWLIFTSMGYLLPIAIGVIVLFATEKDVTLSWIAGNGQFAIFSAALVFTIYYFFVKPSDSKMPWMALLLGVSALILVFVVVLYVLATLDASGVDIETGFIAYPTIALFVLAIISASTTVFLDAQRIASARAIITRRQQDVDFAKEIEEARRRSEANS